MEQAHRKIIRKNLPSLVKDMDFEMVGVSLVSKLIFEPHHIDTYRSKSNDMLRNQALLMGLETRGPKAFNAFIEALIEAEVPHLAEQLGYSVGGGMQESRPPQNPVGPFGGQPMQPVQTQPAQQWPLPGSSGDFSTAQMDAGRSYEQSMTDNENVYRMKAKPRGIALIINNKTFRTMKQRSGTDVDCRNLENTFKQLGFNVVVHKNLQGKQIQTLLNQLSKHNHSAFDCFIFALLTHGVEGAVYGTDEYLVKTEDMVAYFSADRCPTLSGKPKLFFLQACRGERFDQGVEATDGVAIQPTPATQDAQSMQKVEDEDEIVQKMLKLELDATDSFASGKSKMPSQSDMLLAYATVPGYVSWRNSERGSWFVQALCEVLLQSAKEEDMLSMMTMVNGKVARAFESSSGRHKQMPAPVTMLTRKLYFFPGYYE